MNDKLFRALKLRVSETDESISQFVENAVRFQIIEDFEDTEDIIKRQGEPSYSFDDLAARFKAEGLL